MVYPVPVPSPATPTRIRRPAPRVIGASLLLRRLRRCRRRGGVEALRNIGVGAETDLVLAILELGEPEEASLARFLDEFRESAEAGILLVEIRVDLLHHLLEAIGPHDVVVPFHLGDRLDGELP